MSYDIAHSRNIITLCVVGLNDIARQKAICTPPQEPVKTLLSDIKWQSQLIGNYGRLMQACSCDNKFDLSPCHVED